LDSQLIKYFAQKAPAGRLSDSKYNFIRQKSPLRDAFLAQNQILSAQEKPPAGRLYDLRNIKKYVFDIDICNLKLFAITNRLGIVSSLQNVHVIQFLTIRMSRM